MQQKKVNYLKVMIYISINRSYVRNAPNLYLTSKKTTRSAAPTVHIN